MRSFLKLLLLLTFINFLNAPKKGVSTKRIEDLNYWQKERFYENLQPAKNQIKNFFQDYLCTPLFPSFCKSIIPGAIPEKLICKNINQCEPINLIKRTEELFKDSTSVGWRLYQELFFQNAQMFSIFLDYLTICYFQVICFEKDNRTNQKEIKLRDQLAGSLFLTIKNLYFKKKILKEELIKQGLNFNPPNGTSIRSIKKSMTNFYEGFDYSDYPEKHFFYVLEKIFSRTFKNEDIDLSDQENCIFFISLEAALKEEYFDAKFKSFLTEFVSEEEIYGLIKLGIIPDYNFSESCSLVIPINLEEFVESETKKSLEHHLLKVEEDLTAAYDFPKQEEELPSATIVHHQNRFTKIENSIYSQQSLFSSMDGPFRANDDVLKVLSTFELSMFIKLYTDLVKQHLLNKKNSFYVEDNGRSVEIRIVDSFKNQETAQESEMIAFLQKQEMSKLAFLDNNRIRDSLTYDNRRDFRRRDYLLRNQQIAEKEFFNTQVAERVAFFERQSRNNALFLKEKPWRDKYSLLKFLLQLRVFILVLQINKEEQKLPFKIDFIKDLVFRTCAFCPDLKIDNYFNFFLLTNDEDGACCPKQFLFDLDSALKFLLSRHFEISSSNYSSRSWADEELDYSYKPKLFKDCYNNPLWSDFNLLRYNLMSVQSCFDDEDCFFHLKADALRLFILPENDILDPALGYFFRV